MKPVHRADLTAKFSFVLYQSYITPVVDYM